MRINSSREDIENIYLFILGHHAPYLHLHLVPTYLWTPREFWGLKVDEWLDTPKADVHVIEKFCIRLLNEWKLTKLPQSEKIVFTACLASNPNLNRQQFAL